MGNLRRTWGVEPRPARIEMNSLLSLLLVSSVGLSSCGHYYPRKSYSYPKYRYSYPSYSKPSKNVFNTIASDPKFSTLVAAVTAAGLTENAISDLGPLTIFAPTNDTFAKIPEDTLSGRLGDVPALTEILLRHVVPGKVVKLYSSSQSVDNAGGSQLTINGYSVASTAASASVIGKSVASDGRVYAINTVI